MLWRALLVWCVILVCATANGALREAWLIPILGHPASLIISGLLLSGMVLIAARISIRWIGAATDRQALAIGVCWLVATLVFEFGFGAGVRRKTLDELLAAYTFNNGNLWPLVLAVTLLAPCVARRLRQH